MNHLKIWFAKKGTHPLGGALNELRLMREKEQYTKRNEQLTLLTDFSVNRHEENEKYVRNFCKINSINLVTTDIIELELMNGVWRDKIMQLRLFAIAMLELSHPAGHPVITSDIFRLLSPVLGLGAYSDLDMSLGVSNQSLQTLPELILNVSIKPIEQSSQYKISINNNFIYAENTEHELLIEYRKKIYSQYHSPAFFANLAMNNSTRLFGQPMIIKDNDIENHKKFVLAYFSNSKTPSTIDFLSFRQELKNSFPETFENYFYYHVMYLSGPWALHGTLFSKPLTLDYKMEIDGFSITNTPIKLIDKAKISDLSWLNVGAQRMEKRNEDIQKSAVIIQKFWRKHQNNYRRELEQFITPEIAGKLNEVAKKFVYSHFGIQALKEGIITTSEVLECQNYLGRVLFTPLGMEGLRRYFTFEDLCKINSSATVEVLLRKGLTALKESLITMEEIIKIRFTPSLEMLFSELGMEVLRHRKKHKEKGVIETLDLDKWINFSAGSEKESELQRLKSSMDVNVDKKIAPAEGAEEFFQSFSF